MSLTEAYPALCLRGVSKAFRGAPVLRDINLDIAEGTNQIILGGSGSGKSVLLKCILGLLKPDSGEIRLFGEDMVHISEADRLQFMRQFGMLFQQSALFDSMPIWQNVAFPVLHHEGIRRTQARDLAAEKLAKVDLGTEVLDKLPSELSGGMQKRAALARAIADNPPFLFYDEPTTGLDPITTETINALIQRLQKELKVTSVMITHNMHSALKVGNQFALLKDGTFLVQGTKTALTQSKEPYVKQFLGAV